MNDARQQMLERIAEDESLTGDLAGDAADHLRQWANDTALAVAQRTDLDDETVQRQIRAVRTAARRAAAQAGDVAVAQQEFTRIKDENPSSSAPDAVQPPSAPVVSPPAASISPSITTRLRTWWERTWRSTKG
ncbi:MAG: hypothetical protein FJ040_04150 [Chloroflexi bacterium]|nr:hypothetical protein [Chloroflexota bacterium]